MKNEKRSETTNEDWRRQVHEMPWPVNAFIVVPTNIVRGKLYCKTGYHLQIRRNGMVSGTMNRNSIYTLFELQSFGRGIVRIKSIATNLYLFMKRNGLFKGIKEPRNLKTLFSEHHRRNAYNTYVSLSYYHKKRYDMYLGIKQNGKIKRAMKTHKRQRATQFLVITIVFVVLCLTLQNVQGCQLSATSPISNTTVNPSVLDKQYILKLSKIVNQKFKATLLQECNATKEMVLDEMIRRYNMVLKRMNNNTVRRVTRIRLGDLVCERNIRGSFTTSTNQRKKQVFFRNGLLLSIGHDGKFSGKSLTSANKNSTIFYIKPTATQVVMIQSVSTKKFVTMNRHGHISAKSKPDLEALFFMKSEENRFHTLASFKYYLSCPYDMFLAIRNNGNMKSPFHSLPGQDSTQLLFIPFKQ
ncbi:uncharacterized protein LOC124441678 [Xenia sp. Carnegie-2017]|uniref:uncharacterized protein LOC124441678 n=1 Tax=Xenia sp. Carnegie-2017 TaxID=2897299 RepID=UPI001F048626|nr:uncharacterized protein LOC124441678 [Xenia sp. Carnegie-2017]